MRKYLAFDLEIAKDIPAGTEDWHPLAPLGITVAVASTDKSTFTFYNHDPLAPCMTVRQVADLIGWLGYMVKIGCTIATWNGLGFDLDVMAEETGMRAECAELARSHVDMMFHFFCISGHPVGLDKAAQAMGTIRKTEGMHGDLAPQMWRDGKRDAVISYTKQDVQATLALAHVCEEEKRIDWISQAGHRRSQPLPRGWLTVEEALKLPEPNNRWMTNPWKRTKFTAWMSKDEQKPALAEGETVVGSPGRDNGSDESATGGLAGGEAGGGGHAREGGMAAVEGVQPQGEGG